MDIGKDFLKVVTKIFFSSFFAYQIPMYNRENKKFREVSTERQILVICKILMQGKNQGYES